MNKYVLANPNIVRDAEFSFGVSFEHGTMTDINIVSNRNRFGMPYTNVFFKNNIRAEHGDLIDRKVTTSMGLKLSHLGIKS